jgi:hypothetical protein
VKKKSPPLKVWQENALKQMKEIFLNPNGYLHRLISVLGIEITKLRETENPSVPQIGRVFFLAEFVNNEIDNNINHFDRPGNRFAVETTKYIRTKEFRKALRELKEEREQVYGMLFDWLENYDKQKVIVATKEYADYLLRFVKPQS